MCWHTRKIYMFYLPFELNIFWPVYKQNRLFPKNVNSNHKISLWKELFNTFHNNHFVITYDDPVQEVFISSGNSSLGYKSDKTEESKVSKNDSTPSRELLSTVLLTQPPEIIFAFYGLVLCFEFCLVGAVSMRCRYVPSPPKCYLYKAVSFLLQERFPSFLFLSCIFFIVWHRDVKNILDKQFTAYSISF